MKRIVRIVQLTWIDSETPEGPWVDVAELDEDSSKIVAAGLLVHEDDEAYVLAVSMSGSRACQTLRIPKVSVIGKPKTLGRVSV